MARKKTVKIDKNLISRPTKFFLLFSAWILLLISATEIYLAIAKKRIIVEDILVKRAMATTNFEECLNSGFTVLESFPRKCKTPDGRTFIEEQRDVTDECNGMKIEEALVIARNGECGVKLGEKYFCNESSATWWIDLDMEKKGCSPACVIDTVRETTEINWRCTGLLPI